MANSRYSQAFPEAIDQGLEERFIVRDRLENVPISSDISNSPLTQTSAAQPENVTENRMNGTLDMLILVWTARQRQKSNGPPITHSTVPPDQKQKIRKLDS